MKVIDDGRRRTEDTEGEGKTSHLIEANDEEKGTHDDTIVASLVSDQNLQSNLTTSTNKDSSILSEKERIAFRGRSRRGGTRSTAKNEHDAAAAMTDEHSTSRSGAETPVLQRSNLQRDQSRGMDSSTFSIASEKRNIAFRGRETASRRKQGFGATTALPSNMEVEKDHKSLTNSDPKMLEYASTTEVDAREEELSTTTLPQKPEPIITEPGVVHMRGIGPVRQGTVQVLSGDAPEPELQEIHARIVDDEDKVLATATPEPWWRRHQWSLAAGLVLVVASIVIPVSIVLTTVQLKAPATDSPSMTPTTVAAGVEDQTIQLIQSALPPDEAASRLLDVSTPQYDALQWILDQRIDNEDQLLQYYSLAVMFFATGGPSSWIQTDGWLNYSCTQSACDWFGVQCSSTDDVTGLVLTNNGLNGTISSDIVILDDTLQVLDLSRNDLSGVLPEEIGQMTALTHLSLGDNHLVESKTKFGTLTNLKHLDLSANSFDTTIPTELGLLTLLEELRLDENDLIGQMPSQVGLLRSLQHLSVAENRISFALPSELGNLQRLTTFDAHGNAILGPLPTEIGRLKNLGRLNLSENFIFNKLPSEMSSLWSLTSLDFSNNLLTGDLPLSFSDLRLSSLRVGGNFLEGRITYPIEEMQSLVELDLSANFFTGFSPAFFYSLPSLESLNVSSNRLEGEFGRLYSGLDIDSLASNLKVLDISGNELSGLSPEFFEAMSDLSVLDASFNPLYILPTEIGSLRNLTSFHVSSTRINGTIPSYLWSMTALESIAIELNQMTGAGVPSEIVALTNLREYRIASRNESRFDGSIPSELGLLSDLESLHLSYNLLSGSLPSELGLLSRLVELKLPSNSLTGLIPSELGLLSKLVELQLPSNSLTGLIPSELGLLPDLANILLASNALSGTLPVEIFSLSKLSFFNVRGNQLSGSIPTQIGSSRAMTELELFVNNFVGNIPSEIGFVTNLKVLDVASNSLSGTLPTELGDLSSLTVLFLRSNDLSGQLPTEIGLLTELSVLSAANWLNMSGTIPSEVGSLTNLVYLDLVESIVSGSIPSEVGHLTDLESLLLRNNWLEGSLPSELGLATSLTQLLVDFNLLTGSLPPEMGNLNRLEDLSLAFNPLSGMFPNEFAPPSMRILELAGTEISGSIPTPLCELQYTIIDVNCDKIACSCCGCPVLSGQPSRSPLPTNTPSQFE